MLTHHLTRTIRDEDGAVTVDWVVLTAATLLLGVGVAGFVAEGATDTSSGMGAVLSSAEIPAIRFE